MSRRAQPAEGVAAGLAAAVLFGLSAPLAKRLLADVAPLVLAGLLYLGAAAGLTLARLGRGRSREARLGRRDLGLLAVVIVAGGVIGPALLLIGLQRVSAVSGSLLLNCEGLFTFGLAVLLFREHVSWRAGAAALAILGGALVLAYRPGELGGSLVGIAAVVGACFAWGVDNNVTQRLSLRDPLALVQVKTAAAGVVNLALGLLVGEALPRRGGVVAAAALVGLFGYGVSIVLDVYALRWLGAAREAVYFATAPFVGALAAVPLLGEPLRRADVAAALCMAAGVALLLAERHAHLHTHEALEHDHVHVHDEHHQHEHAAGQDPREPHAHLHRHEPITHEHRHVSDVHHRHRH